MSHIEEFALLRVCPDTLHHQIVNLSRLALPLMDEYLCYNPSFTLPSTIRATVNLVSPTFALTINPSYSRGGLSWIPVYFMLFFIHLQQNVYLVSDFGLSFTLAVQNPQHGLQDYRS